VPFHIAASLVPPTIEGDPKSEPEQGEAFAFADEEEDAAPPETLDLPPAAAPPIDAPPPANGESRKQSAPKKGGMVREAARHKASTSRERIHCSSPSTAVFLFYDGRVLPCCHPHAHNALPMGNLHEESFAEIWNNKLYRNLREGLHTGDAPPLCQTCSIVHSPPPQVERFDELVGHGNDLKSYYADREPEGDATSERAFTIDALSGPWNELHTTIERLASDRSDLRDNLAREQNEAAELLRQIRDHEAALTAYEAQVTKLDTILRRTKAHRIYKWLKRFDRLLGRS
jgi:radical SAM protein with 4Fe4S-binding SPASM domain